MNVTQLNNDTTVLTASLKSTLAKSWTQFTKSFAAARAKKNSATITKNAKLTKSGWNAQEIILMRRSGGVPTYWRYVVMSKDKKKVFSVNEKWTKQATKPFGSEMNALVKGFKTISGTPAGVYRGNLTSKISPIEIPLTGLGTQGLDIDPATGYVYIGNNASVTSRCDPGGVPAQGGDTLSIVNPGQKKEIARVATDGAPI